MLADYSPMPTLAVSDLARARAFYEGILGLVAEQAPAEGVTYPAGTGRIFVYPSAYAGTNKATAMSFSVPPAAFDAEVEVLRTKGVSFQTFDAEGLVWDDGVATIDGMKAVWFEDPDGNILNIDTIPEPGATSA